MFSSGTPKGQYELEKERKQQQLQSLDLQIYDNKIAAKRHNLDESRIKVDVAKESVESARISLDQSRTNNSIAREKLTQSKNTLSYEQGMTRINREQLLNQANQAMLNLSQAKAELEENKQLFQLKFNKSPESQGINFNKQIGG